jgi:hypothetical protein
VLVKLRIQFGEVFSVGIVCSKFGQGEGVVANRCSFAFRNTWRQKNLWMGAISKQITMESSSRGTGNGPK